jgi:hypothetical protein
MKTTPATSAETPIPNSHYSLTIMESIRSAPAIKLSAPTASNATEIGGLRSGLAFI